MRQPKTLSSYFGTKKPVFGMAWKMLYIPYTHMLVKIKQDKDTFCELLNVNIPINLVEQITGHVVSLTDHGELQVWIDAVPTVWSIPSDCYETLES